MTNSVPQAGRVFESNSQSLTRYLAHLLGPANASAGAMARLYQQLGQQAGLWAYVDIFRWLSLLCFGCVAIVWMFKKVRPGKRSMAAH